MLWLEKYRPKSFEEIIGHSKIIQYLKNFNCENMPHMIIYGKSGFGKKTLVLSLVRNLYGKLSKPVNKTTEIKNNSKVIEVSFLESNEYIEINPSSFGYQDKLVIQSIVKEMAQYKPVMSFFKNKKSISTKIIVISSAQELTIEAQAALRRTIELYSECFRIVLICKGLSNICDPIKSRCILIRVPGYEDNDIKQVLKNIITAEQVNINDEQVKEIIISAQGSMRGAVGLLELFNLKQNENTIKRTKFEIKNIKFDWEELLDNIASTLVKSPSSNGVLEIRKMLYLLLNSCISPKNIIFEIYRRIIKDKQEVIINKITDLALTYEERVNLGMKSIYHIEAFVVGCMQALQ